MKKLTKPETAMLDHIAEHGNARGFTLGKGRPNDARVIESLVAKLAIIGRAWEADVPTQQRYWDVLSAEDEYGFRFSEQECLHYRQHIDSKLFERWNALKDTELKMSAGQNGFETACELGYKDHKHYDSISLAFAVSTYEMLCNDAGISCEF